MPNNTVMLNIIQRLELQLGPFLAFHFGPLTRYFYAYSPMAFKQTFYAYFLGLAIQWGPVGDIGMFIDNVGDNNSVFGGTTPQRILSCLNSLDSFLQQPEPVVCSYVTAEKSSAEAGRSGKDLVSAVSNILGTVAAQYCCSLGKFTHTIHYENMPMQYTEIF